jgi:DNA polymerase IV
MVRKILHIDLDAFFCAVEEQRNPALRGKPFAVGGRPSERGVVASCSYAARAFGVHSAMPMARAVQICSGLQVVHANHKAYREVSRQVMKRLYELTSLVEQISIDEAFLDVSELVEASAAISRRLQERIGDELDLPCSIGAATNKLVAKIANNVGKSNARGGGPPNAITVVPPGEEAAFLALLPVQELWGVGPKTAARLEELGVLTIGDLAGLPAYELTSRFGKHGAEMALRARGIDDRPLETEHVTKSISQETTFNRDIGEEQALRRTLTELAHEVADNVQREGFCCQTVKIKVRWHDFSTLTRQTTLPLPTDQKVEIERAAQWLFGRVWKPGRMVRLLGVGVSGLRPSVKQLSLWG